MLKQQNKNLLRRTRGFTMVEMIIVLLIGALLMAWGIPNYRDLKIRKALTDSANEMAYSLTLARAEAVRYGRVVTVEPTNGDWNDGWLISTPGVEGGADILIYEQGELGDLLDMTQDGNLQGNLQFDSLGALMGDDPGLFGLTHQGQPGGKTIRVKLTGLAKVEDS